MSSAKVVNCSNCEDCFPRSGHLFDPTTPVVQQNVIFVRNEKLQLCSQEENENGNCLPGCRLTQPTASQVLKCQLSTLAQERSGVFAFNQSCLANKPDCPNCELLKGRGMKYHPVFGTQHDHDFVEMAAIYVFFAKDLDRESEQLINHWTFLGSFYFSLTFLTTIGYGNFSPHAQSSRLLLVFVMVPLIGVFGYSLSQLAEAIIGR